MKTQLKKLSGRVIAILLMTIAPFAAIAQKALTVEEEAARAEQNALYAEISIAVLFVVAVTTFLIYKGRYDKKMRERQAEQMKNVIAKRRAA